MCHLLKKWVKVTPNNHLAMYQGFVYILDTFSTMTMTNVLIFPSNYFHPQNRKTINMSNQKWSLLSLMTSSGKKPVAWCGREEIPPFSD
jgi:hypothetical protein